jgi:hypothetical protein
MIKRILLLIASVAVVGTALPGKAVADRCTTGRVTALTATSISVYDRENITFSMDSRTRYTFWITKGPWQQNTQVTPEMLYEDLYVGQLVAVHPRHDNENLARWVQIAHSDY